MERGGGWIERRVSARDLEVLEFVARFGVVPRERGGEVGRDGSDGDVPAGEAAAGSGLAGGRRPWLSAEPVLTATAEGLAACGRDELSVAKVSPSTLRHFSVLAHLAVDLESAGQQLLSERELRPTSGRWGGRDFSIQLPGSSSHHRPDLIALGEPPIAIEVELSPKAGARLDKIVTAWSAAVQEGRFGAVRYLCSAEALPYVKRSIDRTEAGDQVALEPLAEKYLIATSQLT